MGVLQRFERRLEGLVSGAFARTFGGFVEPVEVAAALNREAEDKKAIVAQGRVLVPNTFVVALGPGDLDRLGEYDAALRTELAAMVSEAAQERGWSFVGPVEVRFELEPGRATGTFSVSSSVVAATAEGAGPAAEVGTPRLVVLAAGPGGQDRTVALTGATTVLGRGAEADVRLSDTGVSRRHAEIRLAGGAAQVVDLGSTNGTRVNGSAVSSSPLMDGDRVAVGTTELLYRSGA